MTLTKHDIVKAAAAELLRNEDMERICTNMLLSTRLLKRSEVAKIVGVSGPKVGDLAIPRVKLEDTEHSTRWRLYDVVQFIAVKRGMTIRELIEDCTDAIDGVEQGGQAV
jgi:predicted XRE-type DNA-binding protein